jgi:hypothetical protein
MLLTKLEKLLFLLRPKTFVPFASSECLFVFADGSFSLFGVKASIRFCKAVKLADCLSPRESGLVW